MSAGLVLLAILLACASATSPAATSGTVVGATVPSATNIDPAGCAPGVAGRTEFGSILPGSTAITTIDCAVAFGSSNDTAQLRMGQADRLGRGMWMPTRGQLDVDFDGPSGTANGRFLHQPGVTDSYGSAAVVQADGKIVVAGGCWAASQDFCLARYEPSGALDVTFDGPSGTANGAFLLPVGLSHDAAHSIVAQADGKLVLAGDCSVGASTDFCVARLNVDGSLDVTFDGPSGSANGSFLLPVGASFDYASSVAIQADGRILVAGNCRNGASSDFCAARLLADGSLDVTFDGPSGSANGRFLVPVGAAADAIQSIVVQGDGRVVAAGNCHNGTNLDFCVARFNVDGSLDAAYDGPSGTANGAFLLPIAAANDTATAAALQVDGRLVASGYCHNGSNYDLCVARFNVDGSLDTGFDGPSGTANGAFLVPLGTAHDWMYSVLVDADQHIVATGGCWSGTSDDFCTARLRPDGSLDATFDGPTGSGNGIVLHDIGGSTDTPQKIAAQSDGELVIAGYCTNGADDLFCLASLSAGGTFDDYVTGGGSDRDWLSGAATSFFAACLRAVSGGASAVWSASDPCSSTDGAYWSDVPAASEKIATTAALEPDPVDATAHLRFALRPATTQAPGRYVAPITFDVLAPS